MISRELSELLRRISDKPTELAGQVLSEHGLFPGGHGPCPIDDGQGLSIWFFRKTVCIKKEVDLEPYWDISKTKSPNKEPGNKMAAPRKQVDDARIIDLNNIGLSLTGIASRVGVHHTTVTYRLKALGIQPADTRRAFMEDIYNTLSLQQQEWLIAQLGPGHTIKDFVRSLLIKEFVTRQTRAAVS